MPGNPYYQSAHWRELRQARLRMDRYQCVVVGCPVGARFVDHIEPRPANCTVPCALDRIDNLRSLCTSHDSQVKEIRRGHPERRMGGVFRVKGCDIDGWPFDPARR
jgi:hypothetical protein